MLLMLLVVVVVLLDYVTRGIRVFLRKLLGSTPCSTEINSAT